MTTHGNAIFEIWVVSLSTNVGSVKYQTKLNSSPIFSIDWNEKEHIGTSHCNLFLFAILGFDDSAI
jgi:hypothetical protein